MQATDAGALQRGGVDEYALLAVVRLNEAEVYLVVAELYRACIHGNTLSLTVCARDLVHEVS